MKVQCLRLSGPTDSSRLDRSSWITLDAVYPVISIMAEPGGRVQLQIVADDGRSLAWFDSETFMTVESVIPPRWVIRVAESGVVDLGPAAWLEPGFWERYYGGDAAAEQAVVYELRQMGI